jgi:hypothetical protein
VYNTLTSEVGLIEARQLNACSRENAYNSQRFGYAIF